MERTLTNINNYRNSLKSLPMQQLRFKQAKYEVNALNRLLFFMIEENISMKNRLSEVLKDSFNDNLLEYFEFFQNRFIKTDKRMDLIRHNLAEVLELLIPEAYDSKQSLINLRTKVKTLRNNIINAESEFIKLEADFNSFLSDNL